MSQSSSNAAKLSPRHRGQRRRWLTFLRVGRYGANNFTRNAWLTTAATAVMVVTLIIVFSTLMARNVFADTINDLRQKLDISFYLSDSLSETERNQLISTLKQQSFVTEVTYISKDRAREIFLEGDASELKQLEALATLDGQNPLPASLRINVTDPDKLESLDAVFEQQAFKDAQNPNPRFQPTTKSKKREGIDNIAQAAAFTERTGLVLSIIAVTISILIIFNTIRMAIFNRREEIQMMKLIGADKNFIQGPFIIEAIMYGVLAALITCAIVFPLVLTRSEYLTKYGVIVQPSVSFLQNYWYAVAFSLMLVGATIGLISSFLAIRRYLKV